MSPTLVPFITAREGELVHPGQLITLPAGPGISYHDEQPEDRDERGTLWGRSTQFLEGQPIWRDVNPQRQRICMERLMCQVCTGPADRNADGWLFLHGGPGSSEAEGVLTAQPPLCLAHAKVSAQQCPYLDRKPLAMRVQQPLLYGVLGTRYILDRNGDPLPLSLDGPPVPYADPGMRWVLASQLVRCLVGTTVVDLNHEIGRAYGPRAMPAERSEAMAEENRASARDTLHHLLAEAVASAGLHGIVHLDDGETIPELLLRDGHRLYLSDEFSQLSVGAWLDDAGVDATVAPYELEDDFDLIFRIAPRTPEAVSALAAAVTQPHAAVREAAARLATALERAGVEADVGDAGPEVVNVLLEDFDWDVESCNVLCLAMRLGGPAAIDKAGLHNAKARRRLEFRLRLLLAAAVGPGAEIQSDEGCVHDPDKFDLRLSLEQAARLTDRLSWSTTTEPRMRSSRAPSAPARQAAPARGTPEAHAPAAGGANMPDPSVNRKALMMNSPSALDEIQEEREEMIRQLQELGAVRTGAVKEAMRRVPRHLFVPEEERSKAYQPQAHVVTKRDAEGVSISSVSAARIQAFQLEQTAAKPGNHVLEIGSGGVNAAYLDEMVGAEGEVTTIDIDPDVIQRAEGCLSAAGYGHVQARVADGEMGVPDRAPFDRILVTVEAADLAPAWVQQLAEGGRIVVPLRLRGLTRSLVFEREGDHLVASEPEVCGFVPMRGAGALQQDLVVLHDGEDGRVGLRLDGTSADADALTASLHQPAVQAWSGVELPKGASYEGLDLWLATVTNEFALLAGNREARDNGLITAWSPMGLSTVIHGKDSFAYLCMRPTTPEKTAFEFGATGHGPAALEAAELLVGHMRDWDSHHRTDQPVIRAFPVGTPDEQLAPGHVVGRRHQRFTISWPSTS